MFSRRGRRTTPRGFQFSYEKAALRWRAEYEADWGEAHLMGWENLATQLKAHGIPTIDLGGGWWVAPKWVVDYARRAVMPVTYVAGVLADCVARVGPAAAHGLAALDGCNTLSAAEAPAEDNV